MAEYIDKQAAIDALKGLPTWYGDAGCLPFGDPQPPMEALLYPEDAISAIENLPSADVEPIVRCKACANWNRETHGCLRNPSVFPWWEDDFCNYGARRDPEADYEWSEEEQAYIEQGYMDTQVGLPDLYMN